MLTLSRETREALAREALARDAAAGAKRLRRAVTRAAVTLGGVVALAMLGLMFAAGASHRDDSLYLVSSHQSASWDGGMPNGMGSLFTLLLLGAGLAVLAVGVVRAPAPTRAPSVQPDVAPEAFRLVMVSSS